ncbi:MAG: GNAT family N-acetyltransferase [Thermoprotei archaeon]
MELQRVSQGDREDIIDMTRDTWPWGDYISEVFDRWLEDGLFLKAVEGQRLLGIVHLKLLKDYGWIEGLRVRKSERRRGVGRYLVSESMKLGSKQTYRALISESNFPSRKLFESMGFRAISKIYYNQGSKEVGPPPLKNARLIEGSVSYLDDWVWYPSSYCSGLYEADICEEKVIYVASKPIFVVRGRIPLDYEFVSGEEVRGTEAFIVVERSYP